MKNLEEEELCRNVARLLEANKTIYEFGFDALTLSILVSQLQLALKHPKNAGAARRLTEKVARIFIEQLDPDRGDVYRLMMMGFDEMPAAEEDDDSSWAELLDL